MSPADPAAQQGPQKYRIVKSVASSLGLCLFPKYLLFWDVTQRTLVLADGTEVLYRNFGNHLPIYDT